ncbi:hypothetical protein TAL182_PA00011 (plasmid) [Rhizobium sp. TAL182]|nr:hypothetical protein TAL182_PA00011 [Rhizobium sp. TAL182]
MLMCPPRLFEEGPNTTEMGHHRGRAPAMSAGALLRSHKTADKAPAIQHYFGRRSAGRFDFDGFDLPTKK